MSIFDVALSIGYHGQETWLRLLEALLAEAQRRPTERQALRRLAGYQSERDDALPGGEGSSLPAPSGGGL